MGKMLSSLSHKNFTYGYGGEVCQTDDSQTLVSLTGWVWKYMCVCNMVMHGNCIWNMECVSFSVVLKEDVVMWECEKSVMTI